MARVSPARRNLKEEEAKDWLTLQDEMTAALAAQLGQTTLQLIQKI
jgi:hypothetical protein